MSNEIQEATVVAKKIVAKIERTLGPLQREMELLGWAPQYRAIVWEALARHALQRAAEAEIEVRS